MRLSDFVKNKVQDFSTKNIIYYLFPILLIAILYISFLPFHQTYIGEWHDIFANSLYYTITDQNYFTTWNNFWAGGFPLTASPHSDKYYIFSFPFYLIFQNLTIVNFIILFHVIIAYFAFFKLGSLITKNNNALLIFSVFYAFSGIMLGRIYGGHHLLLYGLAWLPLVYYFFLKMVLYKEASVWNLVGLSLVSAFIYFTGNLYHFVLVYFILLVIFLYYAATGQISRKIIYYLVLSIVLTSLLLSIKVIPDWGVSGAVIRQDVIDPLAGGGSVETDLLSFVTGERIDSVWAQYESGVMIGVIPVLLAILALIFGRKEIAIPAYFAILLSLVWAGAGKTLFFFIHLAPIVDNFRNPGRIFGALLPLILFLSLYGAVIFYERIKRGEGFVLTPEQKKMVIWGTGLLCVLKLCELPYQEMFSTETLVSALIVVAFVVLLYFQKGTERNILWFFGSALAINVALFLNIYQIFQSPLLVELLIIAILLVGLFIFIRSYSREEKKSSQVLCGILLAAIFIMMLGNVGSGYVKVFSPKLEESPAQEIIKKIKEEVPDNTHLLAYETGVPIWHMDFTYWDIISGVQPLTVYSAYYLKTLPEVSYRIGNVTYYTPDYIVDTYSRENGKQNIPDVTFTVRNISVYVPDHVLPTVFVVRGDQLIPLSVEKYQPDDVIASGNLRSGDTVVLKENFYKGWKVNGVDATQVGTMIGTQLQADSTKVRFTFDPLDYKLGALLTALGIICVIGLIIWREGVEKYITHCSHENQQSDSRKGKKKSK